MFSMSGPFRKAKLSQLGKLESPNTIFTIFDYDHSILDIAKEQNTIPYEIVAKLNSRLKRMLIYKK